MKLETERLILRPFKKTDLEDLFAYISDEEVMRFEPALPAKREDMPLEIRRRLLSPAYIAIEEKASGRVVGNLYLGDRDFNAKELGYMLNKSCWGKGYAFEAASAVIDKCFSDGVHRIYAECDPLNPASVRLLERLGFAKEAHFKQNVFFRFDSSGQPIWKDTLVYALLRSGRI